VLEYLGMLRGMTARDARAAATRWLERLGLADRAKHKVNTLSKGNQQKVQFAGAVLHGPALAVLDEPFSGLDPLNQELFVHLISSLRDEGTAVLLSAHQLGLVERLCDRFLLIARGREVLAGTLDEMRRKASAGNTEMLRLDLIGKGRSDADGLRALLARESGAEPRFESGEDGRMIARVEWPERRDLGPVLTALSSGYSVERVEMRPLSLHEIYVLRVGPDTNVGRDAANATPAEAVHA
jgi:ABC-2 type transport system ATP-binding protein